MPPLQVKNCPPDVYERLRACALEENRSITQQTLAIIEDYLDMRDGLRAARQMRSQRFLVPSSVREEDPVDYQARRHETFKRIDALPPFPLAENMPSAAEILAQIREEEAL